MEHLKSQYLLSKNGHCCHDTKLSSPKIFNPKILLIYRTKDFDIKSFPKSKLTLISIFQIFLFVVTKKSRFIDAYQNKCCANNDVTLLLLRCLFLLALDNDVSHGSVTNFWPPRPPTSWHFIWRRKRNWLNLFFDRTKIIFCHFRLQTFKMCSKLRKVFDISFFSIFCFFKFHGILSHAKGTFLHLFNCFINVKLIWIQIMNIFCQKQCDQMLELKVAQFSPKKPKQVSQLKRGF